MSSLGLRECGICTGTGVLYYPDAPRYQEFKICPECQAYYRTEWQPSSSETKSKLYCDSKAFLDREARLQFKLDYPSEESLDRATREKR